MSIPLRRGPEAGACLSLVVGLESRISKTAREWVMRIPVFSMAILAYVVIGHALPAAAQVDEQRAQEYFKEIQVLCERDGGRLWGVSLCGPTVIADLKTQTLATSQPAPDGPRPRLLGIVNAPLEWGGTMWVAYVWDFVASLYTTRPPGALPPRTVPPRATSVRAESTGTGE